MSKSAPLSGFFFSVFVHPTCVNQQQDKASIRNLPAPDVKVDRVSIVANSADRGAFRDLPGHRVMRAHFLRCGGYRRVLEIQDERTGARKLLYGLPRVPWLARFKVVLCAGDARGLEPSDFLGVLELLARPRIVLLELAFDFSEHAGINIAFVLAHAIFGKSRWAARRCGIVWFGDRRSSKFVRVYDKSKLHVFRMELQFNSAWLRQHTIVDCFDFARIPDLVMRRHILFCRLDWGAVFRKIRQSAPNVALALRNIAWQRDDLHATLRFLRQELRFTNTHRFLIGLELNAVVAGALTRWAAQWPKHPFSLQRLGGNSR